MIRRDSKGSRKFLCFIRFRKRRSAGNEKKIRCEGSLNERKFHVCFALDLFTSSVRSKTKTKKKSDKTKNKIRENASRTIRIICVEDEIKIMRAFLGTR